MNRDERLKKLHERSFVEGQETEAAEASADRLKRKLAAAKDAAQAVNEALDLAAQIAADGSPAKRRLAELLEDRVIGAVDPAATRGAEEGPDRDPFAQAGNSTSLSGSSGSSMKGLPDTEPASPQPPQKRGRGRPPKPKQS